MQEVSQILQNRILMVALFACGLAQLIKITTDLIKNRKFNVRTLVSTGGMPSAHSALVSSLATGVGINLGWSGPEFAIASLFAVIVMYDAAGVRQAAGKQAKILNQMIDELFQGENQFTEVRLKELLGHTPFQVLVGLILGISVTFIIDYFLLP